ncbi:MAG: PAS domain S-box protein, partial [Proteobacteria bacterium]|nr:PAS domain S-box protein [Pseudomonadota bacterium]
MIDYARVFETTPVPLVLFAAGDYRILAANDLFLDAVGARRDDIVGKRFDIAFPASPHDPDSADNVEQLRASLDRVRETGGVDSIPVQRYPIPVRNGDTGVFEERFWSITNSPMFDEDGGVGVILNHVEDVTEMVNMRRERGEVARDLKDMEVRAGRMEAQVLQHVESVRRLNNNLSLAQRVANVGSWQLNVKDESRSWSDQMYRILGFDREEGEITSEKIRKVVHPDDLDEFLAERERFMSGEGLPGEFEHRVIRFDNGEVRHVRERVEAMFDANGDLEYLFGTLQDITEYHAIAKRLETRAKQQRAVSELGQMALKETDLFKVYDAAVETVATTLDVELCKVLKLLPEEQRVKLLAGVGWREGLVGEATVGIGRDSQAGYTLQSDEPVIVEDLRTDDRFNGPPLLQEHGVVSGMSVIIHGENGVWGVLGAHTKESRRFDKDDVSFMQSVANIIGEANRRARTERALRSSEARIRKIIDSALDAVIAIDTDSRVLEWNPQAEKLFGLSRDEAIGEPMHELIIPAEFREMHLEGMRHFLKTGEGPLLDRRTEVPALHHDGYEFPVELSIAAVRTDEDVQFNAFVRDISERKTWETRIQESEERFRMVARATADTIWDWNLQTDTVWWNEGIETVFGYRAAEIEPDSRSFRKRIHPEDLEKFDRLMRNTTEGHDNEWSAEYRFRRANGSYAIVAVRAYVVRDERDRPLRMVGGMNDVSEAREREIRLGQQAALLDKAQDAIIVSDIAGNITFWNKGAERLYGWRAEEVMGQPKRELLEKDPHVYDGGMKQTMESGEWSGVLEQKRKDGSTFTVQSVLSLVTDENDEPVRVLCINT